MKTFRIVGAAAVIGVVACTDSGSQASDTSRAVFRNTGEALLSPAADVGAELIVMGCYGRSRACELVLGGATRTVLKSMTVPVLMAH